VALLYEQVEPALYSFCVRYGVQATLLPASLSLATPQVVVIQAKAFGNSL
jgi:hypothetical protein